MEKKTFGLVLFSALALTAAVLFISGIISLPPNTEEAEKAQTMSTNEEKLIVEDTEVGTGDTVESGDEVVIHYLGTLQDGTKFDSSYDRGEPFQTQIGTGQVIEGWDKGVVGMKAGGKRKLIIPPSMAYGDADIPGIPPGSTLVFEVELLEVLK